MIIIESFTSPQGKRLTDRAEIIQRRLEVRSWRNRGGVPVAGGKEPILGKVARLGPLILGKRW